MKSWDIDEFDVNWIISESTSQWISTNKSRTRFRWKVFLFCLKLDFIFIQIDSYWERQAEYTPESRIETHEALKKKRERETKEFDFEFDSFPKVLFEFLFLEQNLNRNQFDNISATMIDHWIAMNQSKILNKHFHCFFVAVFQSRFSARRKRWWSIYNPWYICFSSFGYIINWCWCTAWIYSSDNQRKSRKTPIENDQRGKSIKVLQLVLPEEVNVTLSSAERSKITGHLVIKMPKVSLFH